MEQAMERKRASMAVRLKIALGGVVLSTSIVSAQVVAPSAAVNTARETVRVAAKKSASDTKSIINGVAVDARQTRLPHATVRLRNLEINVIEQVDSANDLGEFTFVAQPNVPYVVEIADQTGRAIAVGDVIMANTGEVAGAVVTLPGRLSALAGAFTSSANSVIAAAAGTGLSIVDPAQPKVSPSR
jgi:hypothetical protein